MGRIGVGSNSFRLASPVGPVRSILALAVLLAAGDAAAQSALDEEPPDALYERLTEREDERRLQDPYHVDLWGRPLYLSGQFEVSFDFLDRHHLGGDDTTAATRLLEPELEAEMFYSFGAPLSLFAQMRVAAEQPLDGESPELASTGFVERGEMWLSSTHVGSGMMLELGRLDFEDDRLWWWDSDLDALRLSHEKGDLEIALAMARELAPDRTDRDDIEPEQEDVDRLMLEVSWDWADEHSLQLFALRHRDHSRTELPGEQVREERQDEADGDLSWLGLRAAGAWTIGERGLLGYWLDVGGVRGDEWQVEYEEDAPGYSVVEERERQRVRGWAWDGGVTWLLSLPREPRLSVAFARGSGDDNEDDGIDRSFRQTGIHGNEIGFGGVQRFGRYGEALEPELSNLAVGTLGVGISLLQSSSLDLVYHHYRLVEPADSLRDARIEVELNGADRDLGQGVDLVLAVEEWERFELEVFGSAFRPGRAFGDARGDWVFGGFLALRVAF